MKNYRPYRNPPIINFAYGDKNLTIIEGDNDLGKTTLLSAISWCIYGDEPYKNPSKPPCNLGAANELKKGGILTVEVEVVMEDKEGNDVIFNRQQNYKKTSTEKMRKDGKENFKIRKVSNINDDPLGDPEGYRETRLPKRLQEYFLFDGERLLEWFTGDTNTVKKEIEKLSQSNLIQNMIDRTETQRDNLNDDLKELNKELADLNERESNLISANKEDTETLDENKNKIVELTKENEDLEDLLSPKGDTPEKLLAEINDFEGDIEFAEGQLNDLNKNHLKFLLDNFSPILSQDILKSFSNRKIDDDSIEGDSIGDEHIYSISSKDLEYILNRKKCMCGNDFDEEDLAFELLSKLQKKAVKYEVNSTLTNTIKDLINDSNDMIDRIPKSFQEDVSKYWNNVNKIEERIETKNELLKPKKDKYESLLEAQDEEKKNRNKINNNNKIIDGLKETNVILQQNLDEFEPKMQEIKRERELLEINIGDEKEISDKIEFCNTIIDHCEFLKAELGRQNHKLIEAAVNKQFKKIYNGDGTRRKYDAVLIDEKFNISLKETDGLVVTSITPSSGAQLAIALSFITAINSSTDFKLPQVMDTSIGRWGNRLRRNFADALPHLLEDNQLIFLFLDSENSPELHDKLFEHVGLEYELQFVTKDETTIVDVTKDRIGE